MLADVEVDAIISDPPYSQRTHDGSDKGAEIANHATGTGGRLLSYSHWTPDDVMAFVRGWAQRNRGWFVCFSDHVLIPAYEAAYRDVGLTPFAPVGVLIPGMSVRQQGDGPSSWMLYVNVARPKRLLRWGTLDGGYTGGRGERVHIGGKPLWLMRKLVRSYSRPNDLVCDPCAGAASTLVAAVQEGRRCIGAEVDPETHAIGSRRLAVAVSQPSLFAAPSTGTQASLFGGGQ